VESPPVRSGPLGQAKELTRLPATVDLLERGGISTHHARALAEAKPLPDNPE